MGKRNLLSVSATLFFLTAMASICQGADVAGSKDHPLLTRMKDFSIGAYEVKDFDTHSFKESVGNDLTVEGRKTIIQYELKEGAKTPKPLQITRNYVNPIKRVGGTAFEYTEGTAFLNLKKQGKEAWVEVLWRAAAS